MVVRWTFFDPEESETYTFEVNPNAGGSPNYDKKIIYENTAAPDGKTLIFEGQDEVQAIEFSGVILSQTQFETFADWYARRNSIFMTDDLGRGFWIYITSFKPVRSFKRSHPWRHNYTVQATVVDTS